MTYPTFVPSARSYDPGNWAVKNYNAMSGAEIRIRYGDKRYNAKLTLQYQNITDTDADDFLSHYDTQYGTYKTFTLPTQVLTGWTGTNYIPDVSVMKFRYTKAPSVVSVRPGISTVSIELTGVV
tara:strand:+ start:226 stop:597 length:372 start_codon:yes stop_codon:yes gene_type:complete